MAKVAIKNGNIKSFGEIFHVMDTFSKLGLGKLIDSTLGQQGSTGKAFQYDNILSSVNLNSLTKRTIYFFYDFHLHLHFWLKNTH